jgi:hypothetical protein
MAQGSTLFTELPARQLIIEDGPHMLAALIRKRAAA